MDPRQQAGLVALQGIIWGMAGGFFGVVFLAVQGQTAASGVTFWQLPLAGAAAGAMVAAFYSAKRVALIGELAGAVTGTTYLMTVASLPESGWPVLGACALAGLAIGALASAIYDHREGALLVALLGLAAGAIAGLLAAVAVLAVPGLNGVFGLALLSAPVTGGLFTLATLRYADRVRVPLPQWFSVGIVASGVAALVGAGLWALAATIDPALDPALVAAINGTMGQLPEAFGGGMIGGALGGAALELLSLRQRERSASRTTPATRPAPALTTSLG